MVKANKIRIHSINLGTDPEFFFRNKDGIVESTKALAMMPDRTYESWQGRGVISFNKDCFNMIVPDGVQVEIHPHASHCRELLAGSIHSLLCKLNYAINNYYNEEKEPLDLALDFSQVIKLTQKQLDDMSPEAKRFGCSPSLNVDRDLNGVISVDPAKYLYRSAGGHIHLGNEQLIKMHNTKYIDMAVATLDLVLGNLCVILDRDPMQVERRKVYGRAGEYRKPPHGLEYRVLSNFWMKNYVLFSLVFGTARFAADIAITIFEDEERNGKESEFSKLFDLVDRKDVVEAINNNDRELALKNFYKIKNYLVRIAAPCSDHPNPLGTPYRMRCFEKFIEKDISEWFTEEPFHHWTETYRTGYGWENYCYKVLHKLVWEDNNKLLSGMTLIETGLSWLERENDYLLQSKPQHTLPQASTITYPQAVVTPDLVQVIQRR